MLKVIDVIELNEKFEKISDERVNEIMMSLVEMMVQLERSFNLEVDIDDVKNIFNDFTLSLKREFVKTVLETYPKSRKDFENILIALEERPLQDRSLEEIFELFDPDGYLEFIDIESLNNEDDDREVIIEHLSKMIPIAIPMVDDLDTFINNVYQELELVG